MSESEHDARCEREYTENGYVFIDCLCHMRRTRADAWDEGYYAGDRTARAVNDEWPEPTVNPYRAALVAPSRVPGEET